MTDIAPKTHQKNLVLPTFLNMPLNIANLVLEKMETMDRLRARKVCRSLRTAVDKIGLRFDYIYLYLRKDEVEIWSGTEIIYNTAENDSSSSNVIHNEQTKLIDGENFVEKAAKDFKILSKHARKIAIRNFTENRCDIVTTFIKIFKAEKCIHVQQIELSYFSFDEVLTILSWFDAKVLKSIELDGIKSIDQFERIIHLEHWKNAEEFSINSRRVECTNAIVHFFHFKCFYIYKLDEFSAHTAIQIRDDLLRRSTFQSCTIYFVSSKINPMEIAKVFKSDYGNEFNIEYSNGNDKFGIFLEDLQYLNKNHFKLNVKRL
ncbi:F-box domain-containing protein [Caenorhabditis elegans]|uniref:F-box domain-containing protein n=1 Tax=Caenorhabditis elegans TaxID=6239 RepID=Q2WF55_CAEEL|nr:F-box domain-containing protein [Caenorhabditis elegans]CCD73256.1 F-box domain-containing protein [Caenorhabditis elegans]|eukprot:NP_001040874.1 F-box A protein [Caenorhabditis elegans]